MHGREFSQTARFSFCVPPPPIVAINSVGLKKFLPQVVFLLLCDEVDWFAGSLSHHYGRERMARLVFVQMFNTFLTFKS